jgi:RES domain-containing protein
MRTWRIAEEDVALERSCEGARRSGGHRHSQGCAALCTAMKAHPELKQQPNPVSTKA